MSCLSSPSGWGPTFTAPASSSCECTPLHHHTIKGRRARRWPAAPAAPDPAIVQPAIDRTTHDTGIVWAQRLGRLARKCEVLIFLGNVGNLGNSMGNSCYINHFRAHHAVTQVRVSVGNMGNSI